MLGTDPFDGFTNKPATMTGGEAFGLTFDNIAQLRAITIDGGATSTTGTLATTIDETYLIAGKIEWEANGTDDVLRLFNITDPLAAEPLDGAAFATAMADLDQSFFDTLAIADRQIATFDEIRFATTFEGAVGRQAVSNSVPEPASIAVWTLIGVGLAGFGCCRRRRGK